MTVVNPKSISGINSITMSSGSDDFLTIHSNNTTERVRVNNSGDVIIGSGVTLSPDGDVFATGITTISENLKVGTGVTISPDGDAFFTGVCTATSFSGDGSNLTGISGVSLSGSTNNTVATVTGANALIGEGNLKFDGTNLGVGVDPSGVASYSTIHLKGQTSGNGGAVRLTDYGDTPDSDDFTIYKNSNAGYLRVNGTDPLIAYLNGADRLKIESDGDTTVSTGNLVIGTAGKGIDFSAQTATSVTGSSATSEILDHYEEGTFTPEYNSGSAASACFANGITYSSQEGHYTKIGNLVTFQLKLDPNSSGLTAKSGILQINNLPYNCKNLTTNGGAFFVLTNAFNANSDLPNPVLITGSNGIQFYKSNSGNFAGNELVYPDNYIQLAGLYFTD